MNISRILVFGAILNLYCGSTFAHHAFVTHYDPSKTVELQGVVSEFRMRSPHSFFFVDVTDANGVVESWEIESHSVVHLRRMGIDKNTFKSGDPVKVVAWPNRVPGNDLVFGIGFVTDNGDEYGKFPDVTLDSYSDSDLGYAAIIGRWASPFPATNPQSPLPLNETGLSAVENYNPQQSPANTCEPISIPDIQYAPYLNDIQIQDGKLTFYHEVYGVTRSIILDSPAAQVESTGILGLATARIDGDGLVIETSGYPASGWGLGLAVHPNGSGTDIPSSTQKKTVERYSVSEGGQSLTLEYTIEDPVYLTEPYTDTIILGRVDDNEPMYPYECDVDSAKRFTD
jgi:hypothetical protein